MAHLSLNIAQHSQSGRFSIHHARLRSKACQKRASVINVPIPWRQISNQSERQQIVYLSGSWVGHWDQNGLGRNEMHDLVIDFHDDQIRGSGWDSVGSFTLQGEILTDAQVRIVKQYRNRHQVLYLGQHDGEGTIYGDWALLGDFGTFAMRPSGGFRSSTAPIIELRP